MRILMLSQFYPPIQGGEERSVYSLSTQLAARGHHVAVCTMTHPDRPAYEEVDGVHVYRIRGTAQRAQFLFSEVERPHVPPIPDPELMLALRRVVDREAPDIVHGHNWLGYQYLPLKMSMRGGPPLVQTLHDMSLVCATKAYMWGESSCSGPGVAKCLQCAGEHYGALKGVVTATSNAVMGTAYRRAVDMFLPVSWSAARSNGLVGSPWPFEVIPNFLPDGLGGPDVAGTEYLDQLPAGEFVLFVGGLRRIKGLHVLLRAYAELKQAPPLVLIGYDCLDTPTEWPEWVAVRKNWPHAAVMQAWRRSLLGVVPSICQESFGLVALEAMACGKPVIASRIGGLQEVVVHDETGWLVEPGDVEALRAALERLLSSRELRQQFGTAGRQRADTFRASAVVPRVERVYADLLQARRGVQPARQRDRATVSLSGDERKGEPFQVASSPEPARQPRPH